MKTAAGFMFFELAVRRGAVGIVFGIKDEITTFRVPQQNKFFLDYIQDVKDAFHLKRLDLVGGEVWEPYGFERSVAWLPPLTEERRFPDHFRFGRIPIGSLTWQDFSMFKISSQAEFVLSSVLSGRDKPRTVQEFAEVLRSAASDQQIHRLLTNTQALCNLGILCDDDCPDAINMKEVLRDKGNIHGVFPKAYNSVQPLQYFLFSWWTRQVLTEKDRQSRYAVQSEPYPETVIYLADAELFIPSQTKWRPSVYSVAPHIQRMIELGRASGIHVYYDFHRWMAVDKQCRENNSFASLHRGVSKNEVESVAKVFHIPKKYHGSPRSYEFGQALWASSRFRGAYKHGVYTLPRMSHHPYTNENLASLYRRDEVTVFDPPELEEVRLATSRELKECFWLPLVGSRDVTEEDVRMIEKTL